MDTTEQHPAPASLVDEAARLVAALEAADPHAAPDLADAVAEALGSALEGDDREEPR